MKNIHVIIPVAVTTADLFYLPVPVRGIVKAVRAVYSQETDIDETIDVMRGATSVNLVTPAADATAEGTSVAGVPDTTNKDLVFDPASTTVANRVLRISVPATFDTAGVVGLSIDYDESAAIAQAASEA